jgi:hypothetical protein
LVSKVLCELDSDGVSQGIARFCRCCGSKRDSDSIYGRQRIQFALHSRTSVVEQNVVGRGPFEGDREIPACCFAFNTLLFVELQTILITDDASQRVITHRAISK